MKILRWVTGHPVLSLVIITIAYGLINLSSLGQWLGNEKAPTAHEAPATEAASAGDEAAVAAAPESEAAKAEEASAEEPAVQAAQEASAGEAPAEQAAPAAEPGQAEQAAAPAEQPAPAEQAAAGGTEVSGAPFDKLFSGKPAQQVAAAAVVAEGTKGGEETTAEAAEQAAATDEKESKEGGSLFDFFKRKKPAEETAQAGVKPAEPAEEAGEQVKAQAEAGSEVAPPPAPAAPAQAAAEAPATVVTEVTITMARQAFWARDFAGAETMYETLIKQEPENADLYGEFGNMLIQSGNLEKGLDAYEKAADLLITQGRYTDVVPLLRFIGGYDRSRSDALYQKLPR